MSCRGKLMLELALKAKENSEENPEENSTGKYYHNLDSISI